MSLMRLQKYLSAAGFCSRRQGEAFIREGRVKVNGRTVTVLGTKIDPDTDRIEVDDTPVECVDEPVYIALNKPTGYISTCRRNRKEERIVLDLVDIPRRIYPIGRLDKNSTGLLLLTNDGRLHHRLSHPSFDHEKEYDVQVARPIAARTLKRLADGLPILGRKTRKAAVERTGPRRFTIRLREGRNRQIRRMVEKVGHNVVRLGRTRISEIELKDLPVGSWRHLSDSERDQLLRATKA